MPIAVLVADTAIGPVDHHFRMLSTRYVPGSVRRLPLCTMNRARSPTSFPFNPPTTGVWNNVHVLAHCLSFL